MNETFGEKKVSVIIPTYNRAKFIPNAVKSVIDQQYSNIEIIIVDDGSNDDTEEVVTSLNAKYSNIIYSHNIRSKGPSGARNCGMLISSGDYLSFLDSDDRWLDGHLKNGLEIFNRHPEIDVLFGNFSVADYKTGKLEYDFFDQKKLLHTLKVRHVAPEVSLLQDNLFIALLQENFFHLASSIIRKIAMNGILLDEAITYAEDRDFAIQLYKTANATFAYRSEPVFVMYRHDASLCGSAAVDISQHVVNSHIHLLKKYLTKYSLTINEKSILMRVLAVKLSGAAYRYGKKRDYDKAFSCLFESFRYYVTFSQLKDFIKVLMTFIYIPKSKTA